ncbi:lipase 1 isoform X2 [Drosophila montana]|uniref:lipase 1 isoform X2 n=1 Tax=Drosophila montana TaxID=40370 RepID=UPI00313D837A
MRVCLVYMLMGCGLQFAFSLDAICQIVQRNRAECEVHRVQTVDGYQLTVQRIPPPRNQSCPTLQPFVLMHGLIGSAGDYVAAGRASALAFQLHARCFDVWLPNARGTTESRRHRTLSARQPAFWDFSWHEIGVYDLPAIVEHVLGVTGQRQLHYVGHSQGTTVLLVLLAQRPDYNARFASVVLLAPIAYLQYLSSPPLRLLASDPAGVTSIFPRILETTPAGISRGQLLHFGQLINSGKFQQYDYSSARLNSLRYGQATPPTYQLENVRLNLMLFYGNRDALSSRRDVQHLVRELRNSRVKLYQVRGYNHIDFLYATTAPQMIYERIIQQARQIN